MIRCIVQRFHVLCGLSTTTEALKVSNNEGITFKYKWCGLTLEVKAHYDESEPGDWFQTDCWIIDQVTHNDVEMDIVEMDIHDALALAASVAAVKQYEPEEER